MGYLPPPGPMTKMKFHEAYGKLNHEQREAIKMKPELITKLDAKLTKWAGK